MINIKRNEVPTSLQYPEIRDYIDRTIQHKNDPDNFPKPKPPVSYRDSDVLGAFDRDFFSKCYLTEEKFPNSWSMDIEHFIPQNESPELVYEWSNLFPVAHYANMIKPRKTPEGGYLNPCDAADDVEHDIIYCLLFNDEKPTFMARDRNNVKAVNTCLLLDKVHNGHNFETKQATELLRNAIRKKYFLILNTMLSYHHSPEDSQEKFQALGELRDYLSKEQSFTMLCRSIPAVLQFKNKEKLEDLFD